MKRSFIGTACVGLAVALAACKGDPTADLRGGPATLNLTPNIMFVDKGAIKTLTVVVRDAQTNPLAADVSAEAANAAVATVALDPDRTNPDNAIHVFNVTGLGNSGTSTYIRVSGAALKDSTRVTIN